MSWPINGGMMPDEEPRKSKSKSQEVLQSESTER